MSRVITFSRNFPATHPRKGEPTYFVEKLHRSLDLGVSEKTLVSKELSYYFNFAVFGSCEPKHHTIRGGNRWKVGDKFSPRVWSGRPYMTKQIIIAPDIEIKKIWNISCDLDGVFYLDRKQFDVTSSDITVNDGLTTDDFLSWFPVGKILEGQILCWNEKVNYQ